MKKHRIAFVHDDFIQKGGAEKLVFEIVSRYSQDNRYEVEVFTSIASREWRRIFDESKIRLHSSFLSFFPGIEFLYQILVLTPFFYLTFESFNFDDFEVVYSSSTRYAHTVITKPTTTHISYVNSPPKMFWEIKKYYYGRKNLYKLVKFFLPKLRLYDYLTRYRSDLCLTNSENISHKLNKIYGLKYICLYPFINHNHDFTHTTPQGDYYLLISRLTEWKRIDFVLDSFSKSSRKLIVVGSGPLLKKFRNQSLINIQFLGFVDEETKNKLIFNSKAVIFPQDEDFGLVLLEAIFNHTPVIYYNFGGAREVMNHEIGVAFSNQTSNDLNSALIEHESKVYLPSQFKKECPRYEPDTFYKHLENFVQNSLSKVNA